MKKTSNHKETIVPGKVARIGIATVVLGAGLLVVRKIIRGRRNPDGTTSSTAPSLKDTKINKTNLTISTADAALYANTLYGAMLNIGTNLKTIYSVLDKIKTKDDMLLVIKAFGMKKYMWFGRSSILGQEVNLIGWLRAELSKSEISKIKSKFDSFGIPL